MNFFGEKDMKEEDQVHKILGAFCDTHICTWIGGDCAGILTLSFSTFTTELHSNYLDLDWVPVVHCCILSAAMKPYKTFWDWFSSIQSLNAIIANTPSFFLDDALHDKLELGLDAKLTCCCTAGNVDPTLNFDCGCWR